jgi:hypothetical protein
LVLEILKEIETEDEKKKKNPAISLTQLTTSLSIPGLPEGVRRGFSLDLSDGTFLSSLTASFSVDLSLLFLLIDR